VVLLSTVTGEGDGLTSLLRTCCRSALFLLTAALSKDTSTPSRGCSFTLPGPLANRSAELRVGPSPIDSYSSETDSSLSTCSSTRKAMTREALTEQN
jgi:hypothetical protein